MTQNANSPLYARAGIELFDFSTRTYNRLRKMKITNVEQIAQVTPKEFLSVEGFGKKCLYEIAQMLEKFYSSLDPGHAAPLATLIELWRPYFSHPELVPIAAYDPNWQNPAQLTVDGDNQIVLQPIEPFDPRENLHAQMLVQDLPISARARNVLANANITTVNGLALTSPVTLKESGNCGRGTIMELGYLLRDYFASLSDSGREFYRKTGPPWLRTVASAGSRDKGASPIFITQPESHSVLQLIDEVLVKLETRSTSILIKRMGLSRGRSRKTLEAIGREFHLTRERVRQIVDSALKLMARTVKTRRVDVYRCIKEVIESEGVVSIDEVVKAIPNIGDSEHYDVKACIRMLLIANPQELNPLDSVGNFWGSKEITREFSTKVLRAGRASLKGIPMPIERVSVEVARSLRELGDRSIKIIQKLLRNPFGQPRVEISSDGAILQPPRQTDQDRRRAFVYAYIKEQGVPVQIREIFSAFQDSAPELIPDVPSRAAAIRSISSSIERDERFAWAGLSTWGLREWGYASRGKTIAPAALEVLRASSVPLSTAQVRKELSQLYRVSAAGVLVALKSSEGVTVERNSEGLWRAL